MAICLPGIASRLKRAATSAIRPDPLVMTMKFTTSKIANKINPMTTSPPIKKPPNAATTCPAAVAPSCPWLRISRVVATFSDRRSNVVSSSRVGKLVKSSGRRRNSDTISTSTDAVIDSARPRSSSTVGNGMINTANRNTTPSASPTSVPGAYRRSSAFTWPSSLSNQAAMPELAIPGGVTVEPVAA